MSEKRKTQAQILVELAQAGAEFFQGSDGYGYASIAHTDGHEETHRVRSTAFRRWLRFQFYVAEEKPPNAQALQAALGVMEAWADFSGAEADVFLRLGSRDGNIYLDLANQAWEVVEITPDGWTIQGGDHGLRFRRPPGMKELGWPDDNGDLKELQKFVNVDDQESFVLLVSTLLGFLLPGGPYPCLNLVGEQGSAKTTQARICKGLIDPAASPVRSSPREERDLMIAANNGWVLAFDNLSRISDWLSDAACRLSTGGGFSTRQLYTDDEEIIFDAVRPMIINGIEDVASRQDLIDRSVIIPLPPIPESSRRAESAFWRDFRKAQPRILGSLLNAASTALRNRPHTYSPDLPRMADFALFVMAGEPSLPWAPGMFLQAYQRNRQDAIEISLESDQIATAIRELVARDNGFEGTAFDLLTALAELVPEKTRTSRTWPKSPRAISGRLRRAASFLRQDGVNVDFMRHSGRRLIVIERRIETGSDRTDRPDRHPDDASDANDGSSPSESTDCRLILFDEAVSHGSSVARCPDCQGLIAKGEKALFCSRCDFEEAEVG